MSLPLSKWDLLHVFFRRPWEELHLRALARQAHVALPTAHKHLAACVQEELLLRRRVAQLTLFRPQWASDELLHCFEGFEINQRVIPPHLAQDVETRMGFPGSWPGPHAL